MDVGPGLDSGRVERRREGPAGRSQPFKRGRRPVVGRSERKTLGDLGDRRSGRQAEARDRASAVGLGPKGCKAALG